MRIIVILGIAALVRVGVFAQGTVELSNYEPEVGPWAGTDVNAPFFDAHGVPLTGPGYLAQLYAGDTAAMLVPVGTPTPFLSGGYFSPEFVRLYYPDPGNVPGTMIWVQVRAWATACGPTYEQAFAAGCWTGLSNELFVQSGGFGLPPADPSFLVGLKFLGIPEPSAAVLLLLGAGLFAVLKRTRIQGWS